MSSYRLHIALTLCTVISLNILAVPISYLNFKIHQDYYATVLCENPEKPITVCGGICYLKKQLPLSQEAAPASFISKIDISIYYQTLNKWVFSARKAISSAVTPYLILFTSAYLFAPFHPPRL